MTLSTVLERGWLCHHLEVRGVVGLVSVWAAAWSSNSMGFPAPLSMAKFLNLKPQIPHV